MTTRISSGISYLDRLLGYLRPGDNIVWEVEAGTYIEVFNRHFIEHTLRHGNKLVYVSFNVSPSTLTKRLKELPNLENLTVVDCFTAGKGNNDPLFVQFYDDEKQRFRGKVIKVEIPANISQFRKAMDQVEIDKGAGVRYIFDSLTGMHGIWGDEKATYELFTYSCPRLYDLETVAYWVVEKNAHSASFMANLRHITQVSIELSKESGELFLRVNKLEGRFSKSAFLPKRYEVWNQEIVFPSAGGRKPHNLGEKVRTLRKRLGITQKELGRRVGLTPSFVSQLEKNLISPSIDSLLKISEQLGTDATYFLRDEYSPPSCKMIVRSDERREVKIEALRGRDARLELLVSDVRDRRMEPYLLVLKRGARVSGDLFSHHGDEFVFLVEGELDVEIQGDRKRMGAGDSLYIGSVAPSRFANAGEGEAVVLWVLSPPREVY